jgi:selenocysteine lyase/cysteine desulfurase
MDVMDWDEVRRLFPATQKLTYINAAEASPISVYSAREAKAFYDEILVKGDLPWDEWLKKREEVRKKVADLINADRSEVAFTMNTSHGMNFVAGMLKRSGEVVTMDDEFPSSTLPWLNLGYDLRFVKSKNAVYPMDEIERSISSKTSILVTSHVQYKTGFKQDLVELGKLCREKGLVFVVNATQSAGAMRIDVKKARIDFLVFSGLKWLAAGYGMGVLYINGKRLGEFRYPAAGWMSVKDPPLMDNRLLDLKDEASVFELGSPPFPNIFALGGALDLLDEIGMGRVEKRVLQLNDYLRERLASLDLPMISFPEKYRSGITIVKTAEADRIVESLREKKIIISARGEGIRISPHIYNNEGDIDKLISELENRLRV